MPMARRLTAAAVLVAIVTGVALFARARLDDYVDAHRDEIAARVSAALGRRLRFDSCSVSLWGGLSANLDNLRIADDPRFGEEDFFRAGEVQLEVSILGVLFGRYRIHRLVLADVTASLIRDDQGWNVDSLFAPQPTAATLPAASAKPPSAAAAPIDVPLPPIAALELRNGQVRAIDRRRSPPLQLSVGQLNVHATDLDVGGGAELGLSAALFDSATPNLELNGHFSLSIPSMVEMDVHWAPLELAALEPYLPALAGRAPHGTVGGRLHLSGPLSATAIPHPTGTLELRGVGLASVELPVRLAELSGTLRLSDDAIELVDTTARVGDADLALQCHGAPPADPRLACTLTAARLAPQDLGLRTGAAGDELRAVAVQASLQPSDPTPLVDAAVRVGAGQLYGAPFRDLTATAHLQRGSYVVEALSATAFDGTLRASGDCRVTTTQTPICEGQARIDAMQVEALLASQRPGVQHPTGRLDANLQLSASGIDAPAWRASLRGGGPVSVRDGVIRRANLVKLVLGALPGTGGLFADADTATPFHELRATLRIADQRLSTDDAQLIAADFTAAGRGSVTFAGALDARGSLTTSASFGRSLLRRVPVLGSLTAGSDTAITVPFRVTGTLDDPRIYPDSTALANTVGRGAANALGGVLGTPERARDALDRLLGR